MVFDALNFDDLGCQRLRSKAIYGFLRCLTVNVRKAPLRHNAGAVLKGLSSSVRRFNFGDLDHLLYQSLIFFALLDYFRNGRPIFVRPSFHPSVGSIATP